MDSPLSSRLLACREMVGRERELSLLGEALERATAGQPQYVWLEGEAGLGKSRLCEAFKELAQARQAVVLDGRAFPQDRTLPFAPFRSLMDRYFEPRLQLSAPSQDFTPFERQLASTFPFWFPHVPVPGTLFSEMAPLISEDGSMQGKRQGKLFYHISQALRLLIPLCQGTLVLILEDLHWADDTSLALLDDLVRRFRTYTASLLILGTYRAEDLSDVSPDARKTLAEICSQGQVRLLPLNRTEHRRLINSMLNQHVPEIFADSLFAWDEGNPLFTGELLNTMVSSEEIQARATGWELPRAGKFSLPDTRARIIRERFHCLSEMDQKILSAAAIIGRSFDFSLLTIFCKVREHELEEALQRAVNVQLISEVSSVHAHESRSGPCRARYQFCHALIREAIYEGMSQAKRRFLHEEVAKIVENLLRASLSDPAAARLCPDNATNFLAEHYSLADQAAHAYPYALQEANHAGQVCAFREECYYLDLAQCGLPQNDPARLRLLERLALVYMGIYDFTDALHWFSQAREGYLRCGQASQALEILAAMLLPTWFLGNSAFPQMLQEVEQGIEESFAHPDPARRDVGLLAAASNLAFYQTSTCRHHRILQLVERNVTLFQTLTDPRSYSALQFSSIARIWAQAQQSDGDINALVSELRAILTFTRQERLVNEVMASYLVMNQMFLFWGRVEEAERMVTETIEYESRYGTLRTCFIIGWTYFYSGRHWEQGCELLSHDILSRKQYKILKLVAVESMILAHFLIARQELTEAQEYLTSARPVIEQLGENLHTVWMNWAFAKLYLAQGKEPLAQQAYERTLECWKTGEDTLFILTILLDGVAFYAQTKNLLRARAWLAELSALTTATTNPLAWTTLREALGIVANAQGDLAFAVECLKEAVESWNKLQFRYQYALAAHRLAALLLQGARDASKQKRWVQQSNRVKAKELLEQARLVYEDLGILQGKKQVEDLHRKEGLAAQEKRRATMGVGEKLTEREVQVIRLLAEAKPRKEIARKLGISIRTVDTHTKHIREKLACQSCHEAVLRWKESQA